MDVKTYIEQAFVAIANATRVELARVNAAGQAHTDSSVAALRTQIEALTNSSDLTDKVARVEGILAALDGDGDGDPSNDLSALVSLAQQAIDVANAASGAAGASASQVASLQAAIAENRAATTDRIDALASQHSALRDEFNALRSAVEAGTNAALTAEDREAILGDAVSAAEALDAKLRKDIAEGMAAGANAFLTLISGASSASTVDPGMDDMSGADMGDGMDGMPA